MTKNMLIYKADCYSFEKRANIILEKNGRHINIRREDIQDKYYRYDLKTKQFERINIYKTTGTKITKVKVKNITGFFSKSDMYCNDEKFGKLFLLSYSNWQNSLYHSPVRFIEAFDDERIKKIEEWWSIGVTITDIEAKLKDIIQRLNHPNTYYSRRRYSIDVRRRPRDFNPKALEYIKNKKEVDIDTLDNIYRNYNNGEAEIIKEIKKYAKKPRYRRVYTTKKYTYSSLNHERQSVFKDKSYVNRMVKCIQEFNLDMEALSNYLHRMMNTENIEIPDLFGYGNHYYDYLSMELALKNDNYSKMNKYPQNFLTQFQITKGEYNIRKEELDEKAFKRNCDKEKHLEYFSKEYSIIMPKTADDIHLEANELRHCVASYIPRVTRGETLIMFLRKTEDIETPLVTIEVQNGAVLQAYGYHDSKPTNEALEFMREWADKKKLTLDWGWR